MFSLFSSLKNIFSVFFPNRRFVITTENRTRSFRINGLVQLLFLVFLVSGITFFAIRYNRYKNYHNYAVLLEENERLRLEQKELKEEFKEYDKKIDKLNEYLSLVKGTENRATEKKKITKKEQDNDLKIQKKKREFIPAEGEDPDLSKAEMVEKLNNKIKVAYSKLDGRKVFLAQAVNSFGVSNISYSKFGKRARIYRSQDEDAGEFIASVIDDKFVGGDENIVKEVQIFQSKPLIDVSEKNINSNNFYKEIKRMKVIENVLRSLPFGKPTADNYRITSTYGLRKSPFSKNENKIVLHAGVDMVLQNNDVLATADGVVVFAGVKHGYGNCVNIEHMRKGGIGSVITHYAHLDKILVRRGQVVKAGEKIGIQGSTGMSTGKHLHYEVRINNKTINPYKFLTGNVVF